VYRSGRLARLSDADVDTLSGLGIRTVVSLLTADDVAEYGDDRLPSGAELVTLPIDSAAATKLTDQARAAISSGDFSTIPPELNADIHRLLVDDGQSQYAELLRLIAQPERRPLVFHCSHGVHRTGTAAALLLSLLGVEWNSVREDYLLSNRFRADEVSKRLAQMKQAVSAKRGVPVDEIDMTNMKGFMIQDGSYIDASRDEVIDQYGSFKAYANVALGMDDTTLTALRSELVT
jgi:protein-tyrosine phosphatase